ncbi:beta-ketoacyl-ACP synthase II [Ruminococcus gauvreauii]|uniref:beta-ketoacyl-ACP synthase II n=1 Tax=Ruminococcus gauvreauii TaxID=438033 RepID=UPI0039841006
MRRVVVTGMGAITPIGNSVDAFWKGVKSQTVGIGEITKFDVSDYKVKIAAEVKDFDAKEYMDAKAAKRMEAFCQYAVAASKEAVQDSGIHMEEEDPYMVGISIGSGIGSLQTVEREFQKLLKGGPRKVSPMMVPMMISNMAAGNVSIQLGCKGKSINVVTACATGTHSIGEAFRTIQYGDADVMLAGGAESSITPIGVSGFSSLTALTAAADPMRASIPFDKERSGFVIGEGAGVVVLEELEHAKKRNARIYAEIVGYGATSDAYHITSPIEDGSGAAKAMEKAMKDAGIGAEDVDYINAHGTSTHHNDLFETKAIKLALGAAAERVKISSTKSMIGHLLGAAGGVEFITCVKSIQDGYLHPTVGYQVPDEECDLDYITGGPVEQAVDCCLTNSLGFGGHNATLCVRQYRGQEDA